MSHLGNTCVNSNPVIHLASTICFVARPKKKKFTTNYTLVNEEKKQEHKQVNKHYSSNKPRNKK